MKEGRYKVFIVVVLVILVVGACRSDKKGEAQVEETPLVLPEGAIPFDYTGHIYLEGDLDGVPAELIFDTGGYWIMLDSTFNAQNPRSTGFYTRAYVGGAGEGRQVIDLLIDTLTFEFSGHRQTSTQVPIIDLKKIVGDQSDGLIGAEYFYDRVLKIDYQHKYLQLMDGIDSLDLEGYHSIPMEMEEGKIYFPAKIYLKEGTVAEGRILLDTGSSSFITINSNSAEELGLDGKFPDKRVLIQSGSGVSTGGSVSCWVTSDSVSIAGFTLHNADLSYSKDRSGAHASSNRIGIAGNGLLDHFEVMMDFPNKVLYLKPIPHYNSHKSELARIEDYGLKLTNRSETLGCWIVSSLFAGESAVSGGVLLRDTIVAINGTIIADQPYEFRDTFFRSIKIGSPIELTIRNGGESKQITLECRDL